MGEGGLNVEPSELMSNKIKEQTCFLGLHVTVLPFKTGT